MKKISKDQKGEGVISTAIAVLVMAAIGAVMWIGFRATFEDTSNQVDQQVQTIGE
jgi:type VI protein secretion system component VasF